jgi:hypothetical protein
LKEGETIIADYSGEGETLFFKKQEKEESVE